MSIYIDELKESPRWEYAKGCHLFADTLEELHNFASIIGLDRDWFQDKRLPHYDLTTNKRYMALANGANEVSLRKYLKTLHRKLKEEMNV